MNWLNASAMSFLVCNEYLTVEREMNEWSFSVCCVRALGMSRLIKLLESRLRLVLRSLSIMTGYKWGFNE